MLLLFLAYMNIFIHDFLHAYIIEQIVLTLLVHYLTSIMLHQIVLMIITE